MSINKNILFLCGFSNPRLTTTGGNQRSHLLWKALEKFGNVYVVGLSNRECNEENNSRTKIINVNDVRIRKVCFLNRIIRHINYICLKKCHVSFFTLNDLLNVESMFPDVRFDFVVCRYILTLNYLNPFKLGVPVYVDIDDHPLTKFDTIPRQEFEKNTISSFVWRAILQLILFYLSCKWKGTWISNPDDYGRIGVGKNTVLLKNIPYNVLPISKSEENANVIITVATLSYPPNQYGINRFLQEVWPLVSLKYPQIEYWIIGSGKPLPEWEKNRNVKIFCNVPDLSEFYSKSLAVVVPIYSGAGTCIKTLEALAFGRVCLSTPFGARGFEKNEPCEALMLFNNSEQFLDKLSVIIERADKRHTLENIAEQYMNKNYSIKSFNESVSKLIEYTN